MASRTLLLAPPSVAAHPSALQTISAAHDRDSTDIQMIDRLALGIVSLPTSTYDLILLLTDTDGTRAGTQRLFKRGVVAKLCRSLKPGGRIKSQDNNFGTVEGEDKTEAILAGLSPSVDGGMVKPQTSNGTEAVPLRLGRKADAGPAVVPVQVTLANGSAPQVNGTHHNGTSSVVFATPAGVGFIDTTDDLDALVADDDEDDLIDEDTLLTEEDKTRALNIPPECQPVAGKRRRRACKDCTCGLAQRIEAEDAAKRMAADKALASLHAGGPAPNGVTTNGANGSTKVAKLETDDLNEIDFTIPGAKVGSCGNCALGDAFRCDGCPYIGMPAFKPGEEVRLLDNDIQL